MSEQLLGTSGWRERIWAKLEQPWDVIVVGGGITGAGIGYEAAQVGLRVLLVEQRDFAWGTSSRSSKLVHGGLRYLRSGQIGLSRDSVRERQRLLREQAGLVTPLGFLLPIAQGDQLMHWMYRLGLSAYDLLAGAWSHRFYQVTEVGLLAPGLDQTHLSGVFRYEDAQTDDARLVLRTLSEMVSAGGVALNYASVTELVRENGIVVGVQLHDSVQDRTTVVRARVVINATGAWADQLRTKVDQPARLRPLRGSHLVLPAWRLPVAQAISWMHPHDHRPVFVVPWEGVTLVGTTDLDHHAGLNDDPAISPAEVAYLMAALVAQFPSLNLGLDDVLATFSGVRPVIDSGVADPSKESRDHVVWREHGLLTVTGGKLTTFRLIARDALQSLADYFPVLQQRRQPSADRNPARKPELLQLPVTTRSRIQGRYGAAAADLIKAAEPGELQPIPGTAILWAELRWAARAEAVVHLDDVLLRRVRLGLLVPEGGADLLPQIRRICQSELGWDDARWLSEEQSYRALWQRAYSLPNRATIPDWQPAGTAPISQHAARRWSRPLGFVGVVLGIWLIVLLRRKLRHTTCIVREAPSTYG